MATNKTYRYDPVSDSWDDAAIADLPTTIQGAAAGLVNGQWIIAGGYRNNVVSSAVDAWDPLTDQWTALPNMLLARRYVGGAAVGGALYALGGFDSNTQATNDNQRYGADCSQPVPTASPSPSATATRTATPPPSVTVPPLTPSPTACPLTFSDVPIDSTFYSYVRCLACRGIVGGYPCGGPGEPCPGLYFRPTNNVTRGQTAKIVSESAGFQDGVPSSQQTFEDVPPGSTFHLWVERLATRGIIGGYPCGEPVEPCSPPMDRPYFRPNNNVTRGQLSKITSGAAGWTETPPPKRSPMWSPAAPSISPLSRWQHGGSWAGIHVVGQGSRAALRPIGPISARTTRRPAAK